MTKEPEQQAREIVDRLRAQGQHDKAEQLARHLTGDAVERGLLFALREACEALLTAIEAIDPVTQTMIEALRVDVERRLRRTQAP